MTGMPSVWEKSKTLAWFARRPVLWPQAVRIVRQRVAPNRDGEAYQSAAVAWCARTSVTTADALKRLGVVEEIIPFDQQFGELYRQALDRTERCPVSMGGAADLTLLFGCAELLGASRVLETGVAYGWSTLALLASLHRRPRAVLHSVDMPYVKRDGEAYVGVAVPHELRKQWVLHRVADREGIPRALRHLGVLDMCHYDSDKSYGGRGWAYPLLWAALRSGGLLISDDVGDNLAFREFADAVSQTPLVVGRDDKYVGVLRKS